MFGEDRSGSVCVEGGGSYYRGMGWGEVQQEFMQVNITLFLEKRLGGGAFIGIYMVYLEVMQKYDKT